jgi:hypothetical protein
MFIIWGSATSLSGQASNDTYDASSLAGALHCGALAHAMLGAARLRLSFHLGMSHCYYSAQSFTLPPLPPSCAAPSRRAQRCVFPPSVFAAVLSSAAAKIITTLGRQIVRHARILPSRGRRGDAPVRCSFARIWSYRFGYGQNSPREEVQGSRPAPHDLIKLRFLALVLPNGTASLSVAYGKGCCGTLNCKDSLRLSKVSALIRL